MSIKTHLYDSAEPAVEGSDLVAKCKLIVRNAAFVVQGEWTFKEELISNYLCSKCRRLYLKSELTQKYVYLFRSGEEQKQSEAHAL